MRRPNGYDVARIVCVDQRTGAEIRQAIDYAITQATQNEVRGHCAAYVKTFVIVAVVPRYD